MVRRQIERHKQSILSVTQLCFRLGTGRFNATGCLAAGAGALLIERQFERHQRKPTRLHDLLLPGHELPRVRRPYAVVAPVNVR